MTSRVDSVGLSGISGYPVMVECSISSGLPGFELVGLPDAAVRESRERVRAAIKNSGFRFPVSRITLNLAPAGTKKTGTLYDLPILLGILAAQELVRLPREPSAFLGELSLEGKLRPVNGVLPMAIATRSLPGSPRRRRSACRTSATSWGRSMSSARSRSRPQARTMCCSSARRAPARACWPAACRPSCRI